MTLVNNPKVAKSCITCAVLSRLVVSDSLQPRGLQRIRLLCPWGFSRQQHWSELLSPPPGNLSNPEMEPRSHALIAYSLSSESPEKPKNTGVGQSIPSPGDLPDPGIEHGSPALQADSLPAKLPGKSCYTCTYTHSLLDSIPIQVITEYWVEFPVYTVGSYQ